jgi:galactonate dehydratase
VCTSADCFARLREVCPSELEFAFDAYAKDLRAVAGGAARQCSRADAPLFFEEPIRTEHIPAWTEFKSKHCSARSRPANRFTAGSSS